MNKLHILFQKIDSPDLPSDLERKILRRIETIEASRLRRTLFITRIGRIVSLIAIVSAGSVFAQTIIASDFWQLVSLLFSDAGIVAQYWSAFLLSLLETLPAFQISLILMPILSFLLFQFWSQSIESIPKYTRGASFHTA